MKNELYTTEESKQLNECVKCKKRKDIVRKVLVFEKNKKSYHVYILLQGHIHTHGGQIFTNRLYLFTIKENELDEHVKLFTCNDQFEHIQVIENK